MLKRQDIVILLKVLSLYKRHETWTQAKLAHELFISASEVNAGIKRLVKSSLLSPVTRDNPNKIIYLPIKAACEEYLTIGVKYFLCTPASAWAPLYYTVPKSLAKFPDQVFQEMLVLVEVICCGRGREMAIEVLRSMIS